MKKVVLAIVVAFVEPAFAASRPPRAAKGATTVRTALGHSTILEFETPPMSVILGDQDSFMVEFVGDRLAVKPLVAGAKTNLFVSTEKSGDFELNLVSTKDPSSFDSKKVFGPRGRSQTEKPATVIQGSAELTIRDLGVSASGERYYVVFSLSHAVGGPKRGVTLDPRTVSVTVDGHALPIEEIYLESTELDQHTSSVGGAVLASWNASAKNGPVLHLGLKEQGKARMLSVQLPEL